MSENMDENKIKEISVVITIMDNPQNGNISIGYMVT